VVSFCEFRVDNSQCQIEQEEGTSKYEWDKEYPDHISKTLLHVSLNFTPAFKCYTLEDS
jgi:hypothetical protein